jgi:hypothetical protein
MAQKLGHADEIPSESTMVAMPSRKKEFLKRKT